MSRLIYELLISPMKALHTRVDLSRKGRLFKGTVFWGY